MLFSNGKPVDQVIPVGMREGKMVPGVPEARRQDKWKKVANEGKWTR